MPADYSNAVIYKITNTKNGKWYLGSTGLNFNVRMSAHRALSKRKMTTCKSYIVYADGPEHVKEEVIENTLLWLIDNNMINAKKVDGEWEILELDEK